MKNHIKYSLIIVAITTLLIGLGQACSDINLGNHRRDPTALPPETPVTPAATWKPPTITQSQCDIFKYSWTITPENEGLYFLCGAFDPMLENYVLAPNMKFFMHSKIKSSSFPIYPDDFYQTVNGQRILGNPATDAIATTTNGILQKLAVMNGKITYKKVSGSQDILIPVAGGVFYSVSTPAEEGLFEYELQAENKYGVGPVKKIRFQVKKAGIEPVASPQCPGFSNTVFMDMDKYYSARMLSKHIGVFGSTSVIVAKFTVHDSGLIRIGTFGNGWTFSSKQANISTRPCDFETNSGTFYAHNAYMDSPFNQNEFSKDIRVGGVKTYYINIKNLAGPQGCAEQGYVNCAQFIDYGYMKTLPADTGYTVKALKDWGAYDCQGGGGKSTRTYQWSTSLGAYDWANEICEQGTYIDPYYN